MLVQFILLSGDRASKSNAVTHDPPPSAFLDRHKPPSAHYGNFSRIPRRGTPAKQVAPCPPFLLIQHWSFCRGKLKFHSMSRGERRTAARRDVCPLPSSTWVAVTLLHGFDAPRRRRWPQNRLQRPTLSWEKKFGVPLENPAGSSLFCISHFSQATVDMECF